MLANRVIKYDVDDTSPVKRVEGKPFTVATRLNYNCGCGYHTEDYHAALTHSAESGHHLHVLGTFRAQR